MNMQTLSAFHQTRLGLGVFGLVELALSGLITTHALSSGNWWEYLVAFVLLVSSLQNFARQIWGKRA